MKDELILLVEWEALKVKTTAELRKTYRKRQTDLSSSCPLCFQRCFLYTSNLHSNRSCAHQLSTITIRFFRAITFKCDDHCDGISSKNHRSLSPLRPLPYIVTANQSSLPVCRVGLHHRALLIIADKNSHQHTMCLIPMWIHPGCGHYTKHEKQLCIRGTQNKCRRVPEKKVEDAPDEYRICDDCEKALKRSVAALLQRIVQATEKSR